MDDTTFAFIVIPLTITFVAALFSVVFCGDFIRWYQAEKARRLASALRPALATTTQAKPNQRPETVPHRREHELVGY